MNASRHIVFWSIAVRNLRRFPGRSLAMAGPLFVAIAFASVMTFVKDGILHDARACVSQLPDLTVQQLIGGRLDTIGEETIRELARARGVRAVSGRIWGYAPVDSPEGTFAYTLVGIDPSSSPPSPVAAGRFLQTGDSGRAVVGGLFARRNELGPGDRMTFADQFGNRAELEIAGVLGPESGLHGASVLVTDVDSARAFFRYPPGRFTDICVYLESPEHADQVATAVLASRDNLRVLSRDAQWDFLARAYGAKSGVFQLTWLVLLLTVVSLGWAQASSVSLEMKKEIGVLKTVGWQTLDIIELKMMEIGLIGLWATLGGFLFALAYVRMGAPLVRDYFLGWTSLYGELQLPVRLEFGSLFLLAVTGLVPLCAATVFPAWLMGTVEPDSAIRSG